MSTPALAAAEAVGLAHRVIRHGPVRSLAEAARARGVAPADVVKTLVVRRGEDDFLFVLVPGDRVISWPKLRALLGVSRLSLPDAELARQATGYERGTITPLGSVRRWPVIADERMRGREITLGAGEHGLALAVDADETLQVWARQWRTSPTGASYLDAARRATSGDSGVQPLKAPASPLNSYVAVEPAEISV